MARCEAITKGPGAGYSESHRCSFKAFCEYNGKLLCRTHVRAFVRAKERPKEGKTMVFKQVREELYSKEKLEPYVLGKLPWPVFEELPLEQVVNAIACSGGVSVSSVCRFKPQGAEHSNWARYFFWHGQGGQNYGQAYVLIYGANTKPKAGMVYICKHEVQVDADARPERGWHPGRCRKCGLDMTVDSGD